MGSAKFKFMMVNSLTLGRVPLILMFLVINLALDTHNSPLWFFLAFFTMLFSALTDTFDGILARKLNVVSKLGGYADPLTDKIFCLVTFTTIIYLLAHAGQSVHARFFLAFAVLFLIRDQWVSFLRSIGALHDMDAKANWSGKLRTIFSFTTVCCAYWFLQAPENVWNPLAAWFIYFLEGASIVLTLISGWIYTVYYWPCLRRELRPPEAQ